MKFMKRFLLPFIAILFLAACGDEDTTPVVDKDTDNSAEEKVESAYPKTFVDGRGKEVTFNEKPTKIVSTTLAVDEFLVDKTLSQILFCFINRYNKIKHDLVISCLFRDVMSQLCANDHR